MKILSTLLITASLFGFEKTLADELTPDEIAFEKRFNELSKLGSTLNHIPTPDNPWGTPNPDAPPELGQFAFMVGRSECIQPLTKINPNSPNQVLENDMIWYAYYALDGRAIRDEFYSMAGNGEQTRAYDTFAKEWWVTWATVPGPVAITPEPKPKRGSFTAQEINGSMVMTEPLTDPKGMEFIRTITFYDISNDSFKWKSENVYKDKSIETGKMSCHKVEGPNR